MLGGVGGVPGNRGPIPIAMVSRDCGLRGGQPASIEPRERKTTTERRQHEPREGKTTAGRRQSGHRQGSAHAADVFSHLPASLLATY